MSKLDASEAEVGGPLVAHVITTGGELLQGHTLNTHPAFLARALWEVGVVVDYHVTVPDGDVINDEVRRAVEHADVVIVTGGLGPTSDDITRECVASALGVDLQFDSDVDRGIREYLEQRGVVVRAEQSRQAMVPTGASVMENPLGTAPGLLFDQTLPADVRCRLLAVLPGPPRELEPMVHSQVVPALRKLTEGRGIEVAQTLRLVGVGEADVAAAVDAGLTAIDELRFGYCARIGEVDVRLLGSPSAVEAGAGLVAQNFSNRIVGDDGLAATVIDQMAQGDIKIATAESCTGGAIASALTDVSGASAVVDCGLVTYSNDAKVRLLGVDSELIERVGAVSEEVCSQMVEGALSHTSADVAVACSGIAGPTGGTPAKPVGTVFIGVGRAGQSTQVERCFFPGDRATFKRRVVVKALDMARGIL